MDELHQRILKELAEIINIPLTMVFRRSLEEENLPQIWKDAVVIPIFKKKSKKEAKNYRPVSLTPIDCKVTESIVCEEVIRRVKENMLGADQQHGFSGWMSTTTNLLEVLNIWTEALQHGIRTDIIYLDYAKAFDTVPHERLIKQIRNFRHYWSCIGMDQIICYWKETESEGE